MKISYLFLGVGFFLVQNVFSQSLQVLDSETKDPVTFYHVYDPAKTFILMGGPDGKVLLEDFVFLKTDSIFISHLGYETLKLAREELTQKDKDLLIELIPLTIELEEVEAQILDELNLFKDFQSTLANKLGKRGWMVRTHTWEFTSAEKYFSEEYSLMGFGGLIDRKRSQGKENQFSNYFWITEYGRRDYDQNLERVWYTTNKEILGMIMNDLLLDLQFLKPKKIEAVKSSSSKGKYSVVYRVPELNMELVLSENADLLEMRLQGPIEHYLLNTENIAIQNAKIRFFENSDLLVPISMDIKFTRVATGLDHRFLLLSSFIPAKLDYGEFLTDDRPIQDYYNLMGHISSLDEYDSGSPFFLGSKARFESKKMEAFSGQGSQEGRKWIDSTFEENLHARPGITNQGIEIGKKQSEYKVKLLKYLASQGLAW